MIVLASPPARKIIYPSGMSQILPLHDIPAWREEQRQHGRRVVATNGCFDILHIGHLRYLQAAARLGDVLIVGVNSDASVKTLKGPSRPLNPENDRAELLAGLSVVTAVTIFPETRAVRFLELARPDVYVKGGDYTPEQLDRDEVNAVHQGGGVIRILPLIPGRSTTAVIEKMKGSP